jgi:hypothetical protein
MLAGEDIASAFQERRWRELDNDQVRRISGIEPTFGECSREMLEIAKRNIQEAFAFAGISERFEESVLLMRRVLGWKKPIRYYRCNSGLLSRKPSDLPASICSMIIERNYLDLELWKYVGSLLDKQVQQYGSDRMSEEIVSLRKSNPHA